MPKALKKTPLKKMHAMYLSGYSLQKVGDFFGVTRQSVFCLFKYHGMGMREKKELPCMLFNGHKYTMRNTGYYARTDGDRTLLHRDMWEHYKGAIPDGWDVHHKDENKTHNSLENFECLLKSEHTKLHFHKKNQKAKRASCG
jgi:hypothetical protein